MAGWWYEFWGSGGRRALLSTFSADPLWDHPNLLVLLQARFWVASGSLFSLYSACSIGCYMVVGLRAVSKNKT